MAERFRLRSVGLGGPENSEIRRGWLLSHTTTKIERFKIDLIEEGRSHQEATALVSFLIITPELRCY